ncbi:unnamed protein product [Lasius platythorax]|uniref:Uncharacterized protein n=1 Tax=Lasius platythorax TaxID=488582 RepID=A0AAV2P1W3_9HYME
MKDYHVEEELRTENSIVVRLPEPVLNDECEKYNLATTIYTISVNYLTCLDNDLNKFNVQTYERHYNFQNLTPFTEYTFKLALSNFYFDKLSIGLQFGADVKLTTTGKLNAPEDVSSNSNAYSGGSLLDATQESKLHESELRGALGSSSSTK